MAFEWGRIHKWEENIERDVTDSVTEYICEFYEIDNILELTKEQVNEIIAFREDLNEYSPMQLGFFNILNEWDNEHYEESDE